MNFDGTLYEEFFNQPVFYSYMMIRDHKHAKLLVVEFKLISAVNLLLDSLISNKYYYYYYY